MEICVVFMSHFEKLDSFAREHMSKSDAGAHAYDHVKRVYNIAVTLGQKLEADMRVLGAAALLHDVGRAYEKEKRVSHSILSGEMSVDILGEVGYTEAEIEKVKDAIRTHRFSEGLSPTSLEGEILSDADKLDAIGAIGITRAIAQATTRGDGIETFLEHADEKLLKLHEMMHTAEAKELSKTRHAVLSAFVAELRAELLSQES
jgi:uncharacterized protein